MRKTDLTTGSITKGLLLFSLPLMAGNMLQQLYNIADTFIVGRYLGENALGAVGSSYTLMIFLTSILLGLCMGSGAVFSIRFGQRDDEKLKSSIFMSFILIAAITVVLNIAVFIWIDPIITLLNTPFEVIPLMREYLWVIFWGIAATFIYNYFAALLRALGNSLVPLLFLGISAVLNIILDLLFVLVFHWGVAGAAIATVFSQYTSGIGIAAYTFVKFPELRLTKRHMRWNSAVLRDVSSMSVLTCAQQSIMNFGILMIQGLVNSFGPAVMAAFAAAVKVDTFAYMPVQDFGNAFSTFVAQNYGAGKPDRIRKGIRSAIATAFLFCMVISSLVYIFAPQLMGLFAKEEGSEIIAIGVKYLRIEGATYAGIGILFLLYGFYRAIKRPAMSIVLTVFSLGTRVLLAYTLAPLPAFGVTAIWAAIPIGWFLADFVGIGWYLLRRKTILEPKIIDTI